MSKAKGKFTVGAEVLQTIYIDVFASSLENALEVARGLKAEHFTKPKGEVIDESMRITTVQHADYHPSIDP